MREALSVPARPRLRQAAPARTASRSTRRRIYFARDVLMGAALCAQDGTPYPHPDLAEKAAAMLVGRPAPDDEPDTTA